MNTTRKEAEVMVYLLLGALLFVRHRDHGVGFLCSYYLLCRVNVVLIFMKETLS